MKKLTDIIRSFNESKKDIKVYSAEDINFLQYIDESLKNQNGYSPENSNKIFEDLKKTYGNDFDSAKKIFDQNFQ